MSSNFDFVVLISADAEWEVVKRYFKDYTIYDHPYGQWLLHKYTFSPQLTNPVIFVHGGWGKVAAAGSTQFAIGRWHPKLIVNLGTCGGFEGEIDIGENILVEETIIYDIYEKMGDPKEPIKHYVTKIDNSWIGEAPPIEVHRTRLVSADRDLGYEELAGLKSGYGAIAGDWESGAVAWVASKNETPCLILRGVTDLVGENYGQHMMETSGYIIKIPKRS